jgi:hypothetical protein
MRKRWIIGIAVILVGVVAVAGLVISNDLSSLRSEVSDIDYTLGDLENALRGSPSKSTIETVHRRIDIVRDDLRMLAMRHHLATMFFNDETRPVWDRFGRVERQLRAADRQ